MDYGGDYGASILVSRQIGILAPHSALHSSCILIFSPDKYNIGLKSKSGNLYPVLGGDDDNFSIPTLADRNTGSELLISV